MFNGFEGVLRLCNLSKRYFRFGKKGSKNVFKTWSRLLRPRNPGTQNPGFLRPRKLQNELILALGNDPGFHPKTLRIPGLLKKIMKHILYLFYITQVTKKPRSLILSCLELAIT